jgi:hypothetical protein
VSARAEAAGVVSEPRLYADVKLVDDYARDLAVPVAQRGIDSPEVSALEQGSRYRTDGTVEDYQRIEFRGQS